MGLSRRQGGVASAAVRPTGWAAAVLRSAIETALMLRLVFHLPLRQTEGFVRSILTMMRVGLDAPDHTTLSRRSQLLDVATHDLPAPGPLHLIVDSTGLSVVGEGEWAAAKHGGRGARGWKAASGCRPIRRDRRARADQVYGCAATIRSAGRIDSPFL